MSLLAFDDAEKTMSTHVKIEGEIGRKYGIDWVADDAVPTHTAGTIYTAAAGAGVAVGSTTAVGASALKMAAVSTGTGNTAVGDIFTIAGDSQTYVVQAIVSAISSAAPKDVSIDPPLKVIASADSAITFVNTHVVNMVFHRDAIAFANRPLVNSTTDMALGSRIMSMSDPVTGITLRLELSRQYKQVVWEFDILWGSNLVRGELATRVAG